MLHDLQVIGLDSQFLKLIVGKNPDVEHNVNFRNPKSSSSKRNQSGFPTKFKN